MPSRPAALSRSTLTLSASLSLAPSITATAAFGDQQG